MTPPAVVAARIPRGVLLALLLTIGCGARLVAADRLGLDLALSSGGSHVDSHQLDLIHVGDDYQVDGAEGCASCGGGAIDEVGPLPTFHLRRIHRYADLDRPSALGPGVFFQYDLSLNCAFDGGQTIVSYFDPSASSPSTLTDPAASGVYTDAALASVDSLRFFDGSHAVVADQRGAATAELRMHDGDAAIFELIRTSPDPGSTERDGRLIAWLDRNGNALTVAYQYAASADDATLGSDRARLWCIASITDAHDKTAAFTYGTTVAGRWVVTRVDLPNGQHLTYTYGQSNLVGLSRVDHPDGTGTTVTIGSDNAKQATTVTFDDAATTGLHRRETAFYSRLVWADPIAGTVTGQALGRLRRLVNGQAETMYSNRTTVSSDGSTTVSEYIGAARTRSRTDVSGRVLARELVGPGGIVPIETYASTDAHGDPTAVTDGVGLTTRIQRDPATGAVTATTFPDGTTETTTYNAFGDPLTYTDRLGRRTQYTYDANGNLLSKTIAVGTGEAATWSWSYAEAGSNARPGQPSSATDADGNVTRYVYDAHGYLQDLIEPKDFASDAANPARHLHHDDAGRIDSSQDQAGRTTRFAYDACNRVVLTTYGDGSTDAAGFGSTANGTANLRVWSRDRNGNHTVYQYDGAGRVVKVLRGLTLITGHASSDNLADYANVAAASVTTTQYVAGTDLPQKITTDGEDTVIAYNNQRREASRTRTNITGNPIVDSTTYDAAGRIDSRTHTIGLYGWTTYYVYDQLDRVVRTIRETGSGGASTYSDPAWRLRAPRMLTPNPAYLIDDMQYDLTPATARYAPSSVVASSVAEVRIATDPRGIRHLGAYDHQGRLVEEVEAFGTADETRTAHAYDAQGNLVRTWLPRHFTEPGGFSTGYTYTGRNLVATVTEAEGRPEQATTATNYSPTGKPASVTVAAGSADAATTAYVYGDCCDRLVQVQDGEGFITSYGYDPVGNVVAVTDPLQHTTSMAYDARNRVVRRVDPNGAATTYVYDDDLTDGRGLEAAFPGLTNNLSVAAGRVGKAIATTEPTGATSVVVLDGFGRVVVRRDANGKQTTFGHDWIGYANIAGAYAIGERIADPLNHSTYRYADGQGRLISLVDAEGSTTQMQVDANGNRVSMTDPQNHTTTWTFDNRDRAVSMTDAVNATTRTGYDAAGNIAWTQDALGKRTSSVYDGRNHKVASQDRLGAVTSFAYDARGNLVSLADAEGGTTTYTYDRRDRLMSETSPPPTGGTRAYAYDGAGRLAQRTDQTGAATAYVYDAANRLLARHYSDGLDDTFGYDDAGRLTHAASARYGNSVDCAYDPAGRLTRETQTIGGTAYVVGYGYDDANRKIHVAYPGGHTVDRAYTARNLLQQVQFNGAEIASRSYDSAMRLTSTRYLGGATETRTYFDDNQVKTIRAPGVTDLTYAYNPDKSVQSETDAILPALSQTFAYDDEQRLTAWSRRSGDTQSWALTPVGDWSATAIDGIAESRTHSPVHELTSITRGAPTVPLMYDAKGNLTLNQDGAQYGWDVENRLATATIADAAEGTSDVATYAYDALGRRVQKTAWGVTTTFLYDGAQVIREFDAPAQRSAAAAANDDGDGSGTPAGGGILPNALVRVNFQPASSLVPRGFVADSGKAFGARSNGWSYGWDAVRADTLARHVHPLPQYDTFLRMWAGNAGDGGTWSIALPNGTYPVVVVMGDAISQAQTNNVVIQGIAETDPNSFVPVGSQGYLQGDFVGYAELVTVTDATLTIEVGSGAIDPKLCFVEIGHDGDPLDQATRDKLAAQVGGATQRTGGAAFPKPQPSPREYAYGSYVDEPLMYLAAGAEYAVLMNRQYSAEAVIDAKGTVVERYAYGAYGQRDVLSPTGVPLPSVPTTGFSHGYSGYQLDDETGLYFARNRMYSAQLGRFINRDAICYANGSSLYAAYFVPNANDATGLYTGWDDAAFALVGGLVGVAGQLLGDVVSGHWSSPGQYAGAFVGGAFSGIALLYVGPYTAGAVGGIVTNIAQAVFTGQPIDPASLAFDATVGAATGRFSGFGIKGISAGRNSYLKIYKEMTTKLANGTIKRVCPKTAMKMAIGRMEQSGTLPGLGASVAAGVAKNQVWHGFLNHHYTIFGLPIPDYGIFVYSQSGALIMAPDGYQP